MKEYATVFFTAFDKGISVPAVLAEFTLFGMEFSIRWYGVLIAAGFALALLICTRIAKKQGVNVDHFFDAVIFGTIAAIVGARLYFVVFNLDYYSKNPGEILKISNGGLAIYGAIIGALIAGYIVCRIRKESFLKVFDIAAVGFLVGQGIGRWGNFTNQDALGTPPPLPRATTRPNLTTH
ncbi:MAG: prolipoprotein diacylglyceryl transferase, partial [Oscillospiraceae bacterium]|nr:prolipoprotein diacylglyceryl transferase [Oscillospiraceae bacterium]